jgi:hypothetical protein
MVDGIEVAMPFPTPAFDGYSKGKVTMLAPSATHNMQHDNDLKNRA